ncbi:hypothetical protein PviCFBP13515_25425 [Pseudomonas viridiflava]|nr:hypothetical protein PviCFBP13507_26295 [Pseudomonas viridiflava]TKK18292.1 hypothetical protein PviCFBP13515_25425 [Pseudomonas viridiflava]
MVIRHLYIWRYSRLNECPESLDHYKIDDREEDIRTFRTSKQTLFRDEVEQACAQVVATDYEEF